MKGFTLAITDELKSELTRDTITFKGVSWKGTNVNTYTHPNLFKATADLIQWILNAELKTDAVLCYNIQHSSGPIFYVDMYSAPDLTYIFDKLFSAGIHVDTLTIGLNSSNAEHPILYLNNKILRDLKTMPAKKAAGFTTMFYVIAATLQNLKSNNEIVKLDPASSNIVTTIKSIADYVPDLTDMVDVEIREMACDDYKSVSFFKCAGNNNEMVRRAPTGAAETFPTIAVQNDTNTLALTVSTVGGIPQYTILGNSMSLTTAELTIFDLKPGSMFYTLFEATKLPVYTFEQRELENIKTTFQPENTYKAIVLEDAESSAEVLAKMHNPVANICTSVTMTMPDEMLVKTAKVFGLKLEGIEVFDVETVKARYADDAFAQELYKQAQPYFDTFDLKLVQNNLSGFAKGTIYSMMFVGDAGTGKSTAARVLPYRCGIPYVSINFSVNIEESDIFGCMIPNATKKTADDPEFVWQDGILTKAIRNGYCAILEEINFARPGVLGKLNSLLDENRQIDLPNGELLKAHPMFRIIATCNIAYEGTNRLNKALINRFEDCTVFHDLERMDAINVLSARTGYSNMTKLNQIYDVYEAVKKYSDENHLNLVVSMRQLLNLCKLGKSYANAEDAVQRILINGAFIEEPEHQKAFEQTVLSAFSLKWKM